MFPKELRMRFFPYANVGIAGFHFNPRTFSGVNGMICNPSVQKDRASMNWISANLTAHEFAIPLE